jgi:hypothetical protein
MQGWLAAVLLAPEQSRRNEGGFRRRAALSLSWKTGAVSGGRERGLRRVDRDQRLGELVLAGDDLAAVLFELAGLGTGGAKRLPLLDERRDLALEALDAGVRIRHDSRYDGWMQSLAAPDRKKCVKGENRGMLGEALEARIRELALSFPETYLDHPWGDLSAATAGSRPRCQTRRHSRPRSNGSARATG